jgi:4'-phosphopantetheinyl transferase
MEYLFSAERSTSAKTTPEPLTTVTDASVTSGWALSPTAPTLGDAEIHVWRATLDVESHQSRALEATLSPEERARASRFIFPRDRDRFIVARGMLRAILARYAGIEPARLQFRYSARGKPSLVPGVGDPDLRFNLSHSQGLALYALARGRELGIDLEWIRPGVADELIAERFFAPREAASLRSLPPSQQAEAFFACWTRKEAYIKAKGEGLYLALQEFEVSLLPGEPAALLNTRGDPAEAARWSLYSLAPGPGFTGALAAEGARCRVLSWQWPG